VGRDGEAGVGGAPARAGGGEEEDGGGDEDGGGGEREEEGAAAGRHGGARIIAGMEMAVEEGAWRISICKDSGVESLAARSNSDQASKNAWCDLDRKSGSQGNDMY
jgi:hypothetical protein